MAAFPCSTVSPATVSSQLPPPSAAMSMMTDPGPMSSTMAAVTSVGALRPGTAAVVMTTSELDTSAASAACCAATSSGVSSRAYPPSPSALTPRSTKVAPRLSASSLAAERTS